MVTLPSPIPEARVPWKRCFQMSNTLQSVIPVLVGCYLGLGFGYKQAIMTWINEVNPQKLQERGGYAIQSARQLFFFHPRFSPCRSAGPADRAGAPAAAGW